MDDHKPIIEFDISFVNFCNSIEEPYAQYKNSLKLDDLSALSTNELQSLFKYAFDWGKLIELDKIAKMLNYTDEFVWNLAISQLNPDVFVQYINRIAIPPNCILDWHEGESRNLWKIVKLCLEHNINVAFRLEPNEVIDALCGVSDITICEFLLKTYPDYQILNPSQIYECRMDVYCSIYVSQTFLTMAIFNCNFQCLPLILNTCPCFDEFHIFFDLYSDCHSDYEIPDELSRYSRKYELDKSDLHLLCFIHELSAARDDYLDYPQMFNLILQIYNIRKYWFELTQNRCSRIQGWVLCDNKLFNPRLTFLIWLAKLKPAGLPKLLVYQCIYKYIFDC